MIYAFEIDETMKQEFLRLILDGADPDAAARELDSTATQFRRLRNPQGENYDAEFAEAYRAAMDSEERADARLERLRGIQWREAERGNTKLIEKLSYILDPQWEPLRHSNLNVDVNIRVLQELLPHLSNEELDRAIKAREAEIAQKKLRALPPAS